MCKKVSYRSMKTNMYEIACMSTGVRVSYQNQSATARKHQKIKEDKKNQGGVLEEDPRARSRDASPLAEAVSFASSPLR